MNSDLIPNFIFLLFKLDKFVFVLIIVLFILTVFSEVTLRSDNLIGDELIFNIKIYEVILFVINQNLIWITS